MPQSLVVVLEDALFALGVRIKFIQDYIADDRHKLVKVHGSLNWAHEIDGAPEGTTRDPLLVIRDEVFAKSPVKIRPEFVITPLYEILVNRIPSNLVPFPAVAIPVVTKQKYECPEEHMNALIAALPSITEVIIIGWRARERHFWEILHDGRLSSDVRVMFVGKSVETAREVLNRFQTEIGIRPGQFEFFEGGGFTNFVRTQAVQKFLKG